MNIFLNHHHYYDHHQINWIKMFKITLDAKNLIFFYIRQTVLYLIDITQFKADKVNKSSIPKLKLFVQICSALE